MAFSFSKERRGFLRIAGALGLSAIAPGIDSLLAPAAAATAQSIPLRLYNANTKERYEIQLFRGSEWNPAGLIVCDWMMRDWRENMVVHCDRRLYAALYVLQRYFSPQGMVTINSGFRSKKTNDMLRRRELAKNDGEESWRTPAVNSLHTRAMAVDFVIPGVSLKKVGDAIWDLKLGGLGRYTTFNHMDTGRRRRWGED